MTTSLICASIAPSGAAQLSIVREISERMGASHRFGEVAFPVGKPAASALPLTQNQTLMSRTMLSKGRDDSRTGIDRFAGQAAHAYRAPIAQRPVAVRM